MLSSISSGSIELNVWGATNPEGCLYRGRVLTSKIEQRSTAIVVRSQVSFNDSLLRAWQYDWQNPAQCKSGHCFCVHVFRVLPAVPLDSQQPAGPGGQEPLEERYLELYRACSPTFRIVSARRFKSRPIDDMNGTEVVPQRRTQDGSNEDTPRSRNSSSDHNSGRAASSNRNSSSVTVIPRAQPKQEPGVPERQYRTAPPMYNPESSGGAALYAQMGMVSSAGGSQGQHRMGMPLEIAQQLSAAGYGYPMAIRTHPYTQPALAYAMPGGFQPTVLEQLGHMMRMHPSRDSTLRMPHMAMPAAMYPPHDYRMGRDNLQLPYPFGASAWMSHAAAAYLHQPARPPPSPLPDGRTRARSNDEPSMQSPDTSGSSGKRPKLDQGSGT